LFFLSIITPDERHKKAIRIAGIAISLWGITAIFAAAFQCSTPNVWDYVHERCFDRLVFERYLAVSNIITDAIVIGLPLTIIIPLKTSWSRRLLVASCFLARIMVIFAIIAQLVFLDRAYSSQDFTLQIWPYVLCTESVQTLSLITACIPYLKPFLDSLQAGALRTDSAKTREYGSTFGQSSMGKSTRRNYLELNERQGDSSAGNLEGSKKTSVKN